MISRHWHGLARPGEAQNYLRHLRTGTLPALRAVPGFVNLSILSRAVAGGTEFLVVTQWRSLDDITRFSGPDAEAAVVPPEVVRMMVDYDRRARHYEVIE